MGPGKRSKHLDSFPALAPRWGFRQNNCGRSDSWDRTLECRKFNGANDAITLDDARTASRASAVLGQWRFTSVKLGPQPPNREPRGATVDTKEVELMYVELHS